MRTAQAQPALACRVALRPDLGEGGFTLLELMIVALILTVVLGGTITLARQMQQSYGTQLDDAGVEQEARYALDWIARDLRSAGSDPYNIIADNEEVWIDPNGGADTDDSIRIQADINPPDGVDVNLPIGTPDGLGENITIALDAVNRVITRQDANAPGSPAVVMTEAIITDLSFTYFNAAHQTMSPIVPRLVAYVRVQVTARSQSRERNPITRFFTSTLTTEVRLRTR